MIAPRITLTLEDPADFDAVTIISVAGMVRIGLGGGVDVIALCADADAQVERMLNRLRFELAAQVTRRGDQ